MPIDLRQHARLVAQLQAAAVNSATEFDRVAKDAARAARTEVGRAVSTTYNIGSRRVVQSLAARATGPLAFEVTGRGPPISAASFGGRQVASGYRVQVVRGGPSVTISRGFQPKRGGAPLRRVGKSRLPVRAITGPGVASMMDDQRVHIPAELAVSTRIERVLQRRLDKALA